MTKRRKQPDPVVLKNTRADARRLYPDAPRSFQARWVIAKLYLRGRKPIVPVGTAVMADPNGPDFLRKLPLSTAPLVIEKSARDYVLGTIRYFKGM